MPHPRSVAPLSREESAIEMGLSPAERIILARWRLTRAHRVAF
jgi:hypothetical protein